MKPVTTAQLRASATVDLMTAARALGLGRTKAYELARRDQFPCRVIRIGDTYRIPTPGLLELLGVAAEEPRSQLLAPPRLTAATGPTRLAFETREDHRDAPATSQPTAMPAERHRARPAAAQRWQRRELVIWGAHGGAGTSTLATWLQPAWDMGAMRPEPDPQHPAIVASSRALVVTCRSTAWSTAQATKAAAAVIRQGGHVAVVAVVSDGWPEPAAATSRFRLLEPRPGRLSGSRSSPALRLTDDPASVPLPRRALRALAQIQAACGRTFPL